MEQWVLDEMKNVETLIQQTTNLINKYNLELEEIKKIRKCSIQDFVVLNDKYGAKKYNKGLIYRYEKRLDLLKSNSFKSKEEYFSVCIF